MCSPNTKELKERMDLHPELITRREYLWVINNLQYLKNHDLVFSRWRSTILSSVNAIDKLYRFYKGE